MCFDKRRSDRSRLKHLIDITCGGSIRKRKEELERKGRIITYCKNLSKDRKVERWAVRGEQRNSEWMD